jgi:hypothetical protein
MEAAKRIILLLALVVACALPASALTPSAPENRVWEKITGTLETHQEATPQVPQSHQEEAGATAENALECFLAAEGATTTVGRYMSQAELDAMKAEGKVQESLNNGVTSVTHPPSPTAYANAPKGDIYTEFDVPKSAINAADGTTAKIYGPNSIFGPKLNINEMPPATNIRTP